MDLLVVAKPTKQVQELEETNQRVRFPSHVICDDTQKATAANNRGRTL
jgi:hypothetical protein